MTLIEKIFKERHLAFYLFLFAFGLYLFNTWGVSIYILDEAKNSTCAREMLESRNWLVPTFNFDLRTDKPPLHYFFMMLSYAVFGVNTFAARFFSAVFGALSILITFQYTRRFSNVHTAFWTAVILLASIHLSVQFHLAVPDPYLIFFITWSLFAFYAAIHGNSKLEWVWMYLAISMATLSKGPVAILLPGFIFLLYLLLTKNLKWSVIQRAKPFIGVLLVLAMVLPWYILNGLATDWEWTRGFFLEHNLERFSGEMEGHGGIFLITILFVLVGLLPFAFLLPQAVIYAIKKRNNSFVLFSLITGLTIVGFFSVSQTKLPNYTVPSYPFLAVVMAFYLQENIRSFKQIRVGFFIMFTIGILLPIAAFFGMKYDPSLAPIPHLSYWLFVLPIILFLAYLQRKNVQHFLLLIGFSGVLSALVFFAIIYPRIDRQNPVSKSLDLLTNHEVVYYRKFNPSFAFYLQKKIEGIAADDIESFLEKYPEGRIISTTKWIEEIELPDNAKVIFSDKDLFELPTTVIIARDMK